RLVLGGWLVSAWQVSLGFTLGLQYCYLLGVLGVLVLVAWWRGRLRPSPGRSDTAPPAGQTAAAHAAEAKPNGHGVLQAAGARRGPLVPRRLLAVTAIGL